MCVNKTCTKRYQCYRYRAVPDMLQSVAQFSGDPCEHFWLLGHKIGPINSPGECLGDRWHETHKKD